MSNQTTSDLDVAARDHLAIALDKPDLGEAVGLASEIAPWFGVAKVGLELYSAAGPAAVAALRDQGLRVFCDLKLHDIPTTVGRAARVLGGLGVSYLNFHAAGGVDMLRAGVEGVREGARDAGLDAPVPLAVTVLTSDPDASAFDARLANAIEAGCEGVVCSVQEVERVKRARADFVTVVPGVRLAGGDVHDQSRIGTPAEVARAGADVLVIGRAVSAADAPRATAREVHAMVADALANRRV
jgi:orotidine-5'-phosphate decarboxylase